MKATYGFRATIPAGPGKGAKLAPLVVEGSRYEDEVPVGGTVRGGVL
jgi:hypothetical protein